MMKYTVKTRSKKEEWDCYEGMEVEILNRGISEGLSRWHLNKGGKGLYHVKEHQCHEEWSGGHCILAEEKEQGCKSRWRSWRVGEETEPYCPSTWLSLWVGIAAEREQKSEWSAVLPTFGEETKQRTCRTWVLQFEMNLENYSQKQFLCN